jgi:hypothetical protein
MQHEISFRILNTNTVLPQFSLYEHQNKEVDDYSSNWFKNEFTPAYQRLNSEFRVPGTRVDSVESFNPSNFKD